MKNIDSILFIYEDNSYDFSINNSNIKNIEFNANKSRRRNEYERIVIEFVITDKIDEYSLENLILNDVKLEAIVIKYKNYPSEKYIVNNFENNKYSLKISNSLGNIHAILQIEGKVICKIVNTKKLDIRVLDSKEINEYNEKYIFSNNVTSCLIFNNNGKIELDLVNLKNIDSSIFVGNRRIELNKKDGNWIIENDDDIKYINELNWVNNDYIKHLKSSNKLMYNEIVSKTAIRGYDFACIHHYKYRINEKEKIINVLIEWSYGKTPKIGGNKYD